MALPREMRFRDRASVRRVLTRGRRFDTPLGRASVLKAEGREGRILFVVSTRVSKKSTERHLIQRRLNEWARLNREKTRYWDIVISIRPDIANASPAELGKRAVFMVSFLR